jgi:hypothetical protein
VTPAGDDGEGVRELQELELSLRHSRVEMEHALAREAIAVGRALSGAGLPFDPLTFIATRLLEGIVSVRAEPYDALAWLVGDGALDRSVALALEGLGSA